MCTCLYLSKSFVKNKNLQTAMVGGLEVKQEVVVQHHPFGSSHRFGCTETIRQNSIAIKDDQEFTMFTHNCFCDRSFISSIPLAYNMPWHAFKLHQHQAISFKDLKASRYFLPKVCMFHGKKSLPVLSRIFGSHKPTTPEMFPHKPMGARYLKHLVELRGDIQAAGHVSTEVRPQIQLDPTSETCHFN